MRYPALAALLRTAREAKGLDQATVAQHAGLRQQAVSTWERGGSRPRLKQLPQLCSLLELDIVAVRAAGEYEDTKVTPSQSLLRLLPFAQLTDEAFEAFVRDLYRGLHPDWEVTRNGSTGYKQYGIDVFATGKGQRVGIQCKHEKVFGPSDVQAAIDAVMPEARINAGLIALSRPTATPKARLRVADYPGWALWDGEDIAARVRDLPTDKQLVLIDAYFPRLREDFLGVSAPSPWLKVDEYEPALAGRLGYDRRFDLVGRGGEIDRLARLIADHQPTVFVVGRGGIGKTRLLVELARTESDREIRFASRGPITPEMFELLPSGAPVIVLDDALSLDTNVVSLVSGIRNARPDATIVLSVRPKVEPELLSVLSMTSVTATEIRVSVMELSIPDAEQLARVALGEAGSDQIVELLGRAGYDCPLIIVVGAHLIREGHLASDALAGNPQLRREVLVHFADVVTRGTDDEARRAIFDSIATVQPARLDQSEFLDALTALSGQSERVVLQSVDDLEDIGVVMRRGQSVRIVPDLLGEAMLERALVSRSGLDTKWSMQVAQFVRGDALTHAIRNISLIDWYRRGASESQLADSLWERLTQSVLELGNSDRKSLVHGIEAVAAVYPDRAMRLAQLIVDNPAPDEEDSLSRLWGGEGYVTATSTNRGLTELIRNASYHPDYLEHAMELLLAISQGDARPENQNPGHAFRVLRELGEFQQHRGLHLNEHYVTVVGKWLENGRLTTGPPQLLSLLKPALADEVTFTRSKGPSIELSRRSINMDVVGTLRVRVIELASGQLRADSATALAAISLLEEVIRSAGRDEEMTSELETVFGLLGDVISDPSIPPSVRLSGYRALNWQAKYGHGARRGAAREARRRLAIDTDYQVTRLLRAGWAVDEDDDEDSEQPTNRYEKSLETSRRMIDSVVAEWSGSFDDHQILDRLHSLIRNEQAASGGFLAPDHLLVRLFEARPGVAHAALSDVTVGDDAVMATQRIALMTLFAKEDPIAGRAARALADMDERGAHLVEAAVTSVRGDTIGGQREQIIRDLAARDDLVLYRRLLSAARWWEPRDRNLVLDLLRMAPVDLDSGLAESAAELLVDGRIVGWSDLPDEDRSLLLGRFVKTPSLDGYDFAKLLNTQIQMDASSSLRFLLERLEFEEHTNSDYRALPHSWGEQLAFRDSASFSRTLAELVEWILEVDGWKRASLGSQLFEQITGRIDAETLTVLLELIRSEDSAEIRLAVDLLQHAHRHFVLEHPGFVETALSVAGHADEATARVLIRGLHAPAIYGTWSRTIGVDDPEEIALRDGAYALAQRHPMNSRVRSFYEDVSRLADNRIEEERVDDKSLWEPRRW
ncbi:transcriptional regulator with XRE-family HTH domain [Leucobacter komagatae]|uniref:Transcriptional regulator with XRE-family HTH domain n=1 Tax=Leucobacter komagatae TaxID=55969 RepID=A0A542Y3F6_9MICO|nr:helix-turn-helix domain-containing protein [Leucobacter komagatae]TQL42615.1 transcriptional regulator with XRE-family HTH domain [Leucobacter komagatae]